MILTLVSGQTDEASTNAALKKMVTNLMNYYVPGQTAEKGVIRPNTSPGPDGFQWYEGGIMWGAIMEYIRLTGDTTYSETVSQALVLASEGQTASFLGKIPTLAETLEGKWNDDILWWGLPCVTSAEIYGANAQMAGGKSFVNLANTTYAQVFAQWSPSCQGGIYWSRDRNNDKSKGYKSTITHAQEMMLGARLSIVTGQSKYIQEADMQYQWLKRSKIIADNGQVFDGLDDTKNCAVFVQELSYKAGFLIGALAWMFRASNDITYINQANLIATRSMQTFARQGILTDQCEPNCNIY